MPPCPDPLNIARHNEKIRRKIWWWRTSQTVSQPYQLPGVPRQNSFKTPPPGRVRHIETREKEGGRNESQTVSSSHSVSRLGAYPSNVTLCSPTQACRRNWSMPPCPDPRNIARQNEKIRRKIWWRSTSQTVSQPYQLPGVPRQNSFKTPLPGRVRHIETREKEGGRNESQTVSSSHSVSRLGTTPQT